MSVENRFANGRRADDAAGITAGGDEPSAAPCDDAGHEETGPAAFQRLIDDAAELREEVGLLWSAKVDAVRLSLRRLILLVVLGLLAAVVGAASLITCTVLLLLGIAGGLGELFDRLWLGNLATGGILIAGTALCVYLIVRGMTRRSREATVQKYEKLREQRLARRAQRHHERQASEQAVRS